MIRAVEPHLSGKARDGIATHRVKILTCRNVPSSHAVYGKVSKQGFSECQSSNEVLWA